MTATQRTLRALEQRGCVCGMVERYNPYSQKRHDLFGIFDLIAMYPNQIYGIQSTTSDFTGHDKKILAEPRAIEWLKCGGGIELWAWRKVKKKRGGKLMVWQPRIKSYTLDDFNEICDE